MQNVIGTTKPIEIPAELKYKLKINGDYSFIAIPTDVLDKYGVDSFEITIDSNNKMVLVVPRHGSEGPTTGNTTHNRGSYNVKWEQAYTLLPNFT